MKLLFVSDIHGSAYYTERLLEIYRKENAGKMVILGDILYHGPRNDLPCEYNPKRVTELLNSVSGEILCVKGNCDAEIDQMVLDFPIMADYMVLYLNERMVFVTHGHLYNKDNLPKFKDGDIMIHGHTHEKVAADMGGYVYINPGSISIPKDDEIHSYMTYEDGLFQIKSVDGDVIKEYRI